MLPLSIAILIVGTLFVLTGHARKGQQVKANIAAMKEAEAALAANLDRERAAGITYETTEYRRLSRAANEAAAKVPVRYGGTKHS
ncbi:hypothetical protein [Streptomyces malaysiensis]|uniref:Uncharacterized protein n=1 Tax=Streptomyces malaysiensis subsp. samsunensis TaxID=459658 RepID=A0A9X2M1L0_STRMQ|nr:hypothetical protein [Streptomyces samsunensis]MCQ8833763.1 hypothetical protein [Streptomyces samsunensis]